MFTSEQDIDRALVELEIEETHFMKCSHETAIEVTDKIFRTYVEGEPAVWWFTLKHIVKRHSYEGDGYLHLLEYLPDKDTECWFVPDNAPFRYTVVYRGKIGLLSSILGDCDVMEYYVVDISFNWLLVENNSDQIIYCEI